MNLISSFVKIFNEIKITTKNSKIPKNELYINKLNFSL